MPSKHTFSATTDCMISERCSEITSCHLSAGPGLLMFTRSNLAPTQVPTSKHRRRRAVVWSCELHDTQYIAGFDLVRHFWQAENPRKLAGIEFGQWLGRSSIGKFGHWESEEVCGSTFNVLSFLLCFTSPRDLSGRRTMSDSTLL